MISPDRLRRAIAEMRLADDLRHEHVRRARIESEYDCLYVGYRHTALAECLDGAEYYVHVGPLEGVCGEWPGCDEAAPSEQLVAMMAAAVNRKANEIAREFAVL